MHSLFNKHDDFILKDVFFQSCHIFSINADDGDGTHLVPAGTDLA
jgi:hypothetical protein